MTKIRVPADNLADREFLTVDTDLAIAAGAWNGVTKVNKFGYAPDGAQVTGADIWDRADATPTQSIWVAPTASLTHTIKSTSVSDTFGIGAGAGAEVVRVSGLTDWDSKEVHEDVQMNGTTGTATANTYVIIHRMQVVTYNLSAVNHGTITAGWGLGNVTAQINPGWGQTEMALYGIPSIQTAYLTNWYASIQKSSGVAADCNFRLNYSQDPESAPSLFVTKEIRGLQSTGSSNGRWLHAPYKEFNGPGILKITAYSSSADLDVTGGFDLILLDN